MADELNELKERRKSDVASPFLLFFPSKRGLLNYLLLRFDILSSRLNIRLCIS